MNVSLSLSIYIYIYIHMYIYIYMCICVYIYIYMYTHLLRLECLAKGASKLRGSPLAADREMARMARQLATPHVHT